MRGFATVESVATVGSLVATIATLIGVMLRVLVRQGDQWQQIIRAKDHQIATLQAELDELRGEVHALRDQLEAMRRRHG
jgi:cell division protein FtsB